MRAAGVAESSERVASAYWRLVQHVPRLQARVGTFDTYLPTDLAAHGGGVGRAAFFGKHAIRFGARTMQLRSLVCRYDAIFVQRGVYPMGPATVARPLGKFDGRVVLDLDDAVFAVHPGLADRSVVARWLYGGRQARFLLDRADAVIVSTDELSAMLPGRDADLVLPTIPNLANSRQISYREQLPIRVGWMGNAGNLRYLDPLRPVFHRLRSEGVATLEVLCSEAWDGPADFRRWSREGEERAMMDYDVGIMPLPDTPYTRAKGGFKLLMHMAVGTPVVASPVGVNEAIIDASGGGLLASSPLDWEDALRVLAADVAGRARMGRSARAFMERYADVEAHADAIVALLSGRPRVSALPQLRSSQPTSSIPGRLGTGDS